MAVCKSCGLDLGEGNPICPLCFPDNDEMAVPVSPADLFRQSEKASRRHAYETVMMLLASAVVVTLATDAVFGRGMWWSLLTSACLVYTGIVISVLYFSSGRPYTAIASGATATLLFLLATDLLTGPSDWFLAVAAPLTAALFLLSATVVILNSRSRYRGMNLLATIMFAAAVFTVVTEAVADNFTSGQFRLQWSVVASASLTVMGVIFIFIHYRLKRGRHIGRLFHI